MLLTKTVIMKWSPSNIKHFTSKEYIFTKMGDEFEARVEDLTNGSSVLVEVKCDCCNKILNPIRWQDYLKCIKNDGKYYCRKCVMELYGNKNISKSKCKYSFAQWGIDNICPDFLEKYWDYEKNNKLDINPWEIGHGSEKKVWIKCQKKDYHGSYNIICYSFTSSNNRCPYCNHNSGKVHSKDSLGQYIIDNYGQDFLDKIWSEKNKKSPLEYSPKSHKKVWWRCQDGSHDEYYRDIQYSTNSEYRCPECVRERDESIIQEKVRLYLESLGYDVLHEHNCTLIPKNPRKSNTTNNILPYDNEIVELKLICEVHGIQHYEVTGFHKMHAKRNNTTLEQELKYQQWKDKYKREYALLKGYYYLEIPYWTDNKEEQYKKLIDDKIKEILDLKELLK